MTKNIILCADDYAQNPTISQGIINLIAQNRLSATSCIVTTKYWQEHAAWLNSYNEHIDIGLHFNLTFGSPLTDMPNTAFNRQFPTLKQLILNSFLKKITYQEIYQELNCQLDKFISALGRLPDFIDGHEHIHCLPVIRQVIIDCYHQRLKGNNSWVRNICAKNLLQLLHKPAAIKKSILYLVGGKALKNNLIQTKIPHNTNFAGVYNFKTKLDYSEIFPLFLKDVSKRSLIMCHPGLPSQDREDPIAASRGAEYAYFSSSAFINHCEQYQINLTRFNH